MPHDLHTLENKPRTHRTKPLLERTRRPTPKNDHNRIPNNKHTTRTRIQKSIQNRPQRRKHKTTQIPKQHTKNLDTRTNKRNTLDSNHILLLRVHNHTNREVKQ